MRNRGWSATVHFPRNGPSLFSVAHRVQTKHQCERALQPSKAPLASDAAWPSPPHPHGAALARPRDTSTPSLTSPSPSPAILLRRPPRLWSPRTSPPAASPRTSPPPAPRFSPAAHPSSAQGLW
ncbi:hypothetical protein VPH35_035897 [Triticum aestivum]